MKKQNYNFKEKRKKFILVFKKAEKHYSVNKKRLAGEEWNEPWQTLIATILSAQTRDETTIPVAEELFRKKTLKQLAESSPVEIKKIISKINYNNTKAKNIILAAKHLLENHKGEVPDNMNELLLIPGVGRKTANLILGEIFQKEAICVDTHVHRISNVLGLVSTKTPEETEKELMLIAPKKYWNKINRIFVLWGKEVTGHSEEKFLKIFEKNR